MRSDSGTVGFSGQTSFSESTLHTGGSGKEGGQDQGDEADGQTPDERPDGQTWGGSFSPLTEVLGGAGEVK